MILKKGKTNNKMIRNDKLIHVRKQHKKCFIENDEDDLQFPFVSFLNYNEIHFMF